MNKHTFLRLVRAVARFVLSIIARIEIVGSIDYQTGGFIITGNHVGRLEAFLVILLAERDDIVLILAEKYKKYTGLRDDATRQGTQALDRIRDHQLR